LWELPADFEWTKIERELSSYSEFVDGLEALEGKSDLLKLFEKFPGASLCHSFYDHGSPGCSGFYLEAFVKRRHLDYVQNAFTALLKAIDSQLASVHKGLRLGDLCKELAFGTQCAGGQGRSLYNSCTFSVLRHQFLERAIEKLV